MKKELTNEKLLQRGKIARPKKDDLIAEAKLTNDIKQPEKIELEGSQISLENIHNTESKKLLKPKSISRLFNSVSKLNGNHQKLVYQEKIVDDELIEVIEETEDKIEFPEDSLPVVIKDEKSLKFTKSARISEMAKKWDSKNINVKDPDSLIESDNYNASLTSNPKMLKRLYNTKRRILEGEKPNQSN